MTNWYLLGIDIGTTSLKLAVLDSRSKIAARVLRPCRVLSPAKNEAQLDAAFLWNSLLSGLQELRDGKGIDPGRIAGIGISCLCPGFVPLSGEGEALLDPILYSDRRSVEEADLIRERVGEDRLFAITGNGSMAGAFSGSSLLWVRKHHPDIYRSARYFGHLNTWLAAKLTGRFGMDHTNASYTNLFETAGQKCWSDEICGLLDIDPAKLPPLMESSAPVGTLKNKAFLNLGFREGTPVAIGGADTPCASLAAGVVRHGDVCESAGTTDVLTVCLDRPLFDRRFINRCHVVPGTYIYQGAMSFTGASNQWFLNTLCPDLAAAPAGAHTAAHTALTTPGRDSYRLLNEEAASAPAGCGGVVFLPYMQGERSPVWDPDARGVFFGLNLKTTRADMNRAVLESCGYGLRQLKEIAEEKLGMPVTHFPSFGGGAKSAVWSKIKADITGCRIDILEENDLAPVGAALLAGTGAGVFRDVFEASESFERKITNTVLPDRSADGAYERGYRAYTALYPALKDVFAFYGRPL